MTTRTAEVGTSLYIAAFFALLIGFGTVVATGHVQADTLHNAAHDMRHANGFPCH